MKNITKFLSLTALALVGAVMIGCSSDDNTIDEPRQPERKANVVTLTTTVNFAGTRALTAGGVKTFAQGDQIAIIYQDINGATQKAETEKLTAADIATDGKSATFTVTLTDPKASSSVKYIYPAVMAGATDVNYEALASPQDGTLETLASKLDLATFDGTLTETATLPASPLLTNQLVVIAYTLKDADGTNDLTSTITSMSISDGTNDYTVSRSAAAGPIYVAIRPTESANIQYTATDGTYYYIKSVTSKTYAAGNLYQLGLRMAKEFALAVDLGLPSGIKWANLNIGATKPSDSGLYFAWGETTGYSKDIFDGRVFDWASYAWSGSAQSTITKYCTNETFGTVDSKNKLDLDDDAAHVNWGGKWRMPTSAEFSELINNTTWTWTTVDGVSGWTFTSKTNSNSIFLPAAGYRSSNYADFVNNRGRYWSSTLLESNQNSACNLGFGETYVTVYNDLRINALTIRPVQE